MSKKAWILSRTRVADPAGRRQAAKPDGGRGRVAAILAVGLVVLSLPAAGGAVPGEKAGTVLSTEDVVRMWVAGRPTEEILNEIRTREAEFDLDPEILAELRLTGIPEVLVEGMLERQAELDALAAPPEGEPFVEPDPVLMVHLSAKEPGKKEKPDDESVLVYPTVLLDQDLAVEHGLGFDRTDRAVTDLAIFLACRTPDHVPDQWRSKTPLGRDFVQAPRHRLLAFGAGALPAAAGKSAKLKARFAEWLGAGAAPTEFLQLEVPAALSVSLEPELAHDLILGVAARVGGRYIVLAQDGSDGVVPSPDGSQLEASVWSRIRGAGFSLGARFGEPEVNTVDTEPEQDP